MGFSRQEYWSGLPFPSPGDLLDPGIELRPPVLHADSLPTELQGKLFLYAEYIFQNARLDETQAGIKISGRTVNDLIYADDTSPMGESKE